ncbi:MAG: DNA (cytosine-5-)-methyltransferase [Xanthomonadales bacterium]|nr:DNA (cytosine-5-)-methyltransferase [Xanthomonadales bacterium]
METRHNLTQFALLRRQASLTIKEAAAALDVSTRQAKRYESGDCALNRAQIELLQTRVEKIRSEHIGEKKKYRFIDLFAGIGGFRKGFEKHGECVFTCEYDDACWDTYMKNFSCTHDLAKDIKDVEIPKIPEFDVLLAGFPCQPFSLAGVSKKNSLGRLHGFKCEDQGQLFFDVARIIEHHRPAAFVLENVKNLRSHDRGKTYKVIMSTLEGLGYSFLDDVIIDAKHFVPQHRERIFIAGFRSDVNFSFKALRDELRRMGFSHKMDEVLHNGNDELDPQYVSEKSGMPLSKYTLSDKLWKYLQDYRAKHEAAGNGFGFSAVSTNDTARTLSARYHKDGSEILVTQEKKNPRRLTPRECARLMGFDRPLSSNWKIPVSDTQAYRQFGNAVVVPVIEKLADYLDPFIEQSIAAPQSQVSINFSLKDQLESATG